MTLGQKLTLSISGLLLMLSILAVSSLYSIGQLGNDLNETAAITGRKLDLAGTVAVESAEMLSLERGFIVRLYMKDLAKAEEYHNQFLERAKSLTAATDELRPMIFNNEAKRNLAQLQSGISSWAPAHEEMWMRGKNGQFEEALAIQSTRTLPIAKDLQKAANDLKQIQRKVLVEAIANAASAVPRSRWIEIALVAIFAVMGAWILWIVRRASRNLQHMAGQLGESAEQITSVATQVASASQSLAQGASEQASSLEETSASTEEITAMTRKNAESSRNAVEVMNTVDQNIKEGNRTIGEMVVSMQEIKDSSGKISKIIKVIDEIAFQTNILALNAAVEAARAGQAGMSFAVVADEVRSLAQRSAQAAKDTASLIEDSIAKSTEGNTKLQRVTEVIGAITESSTQVKARVDDVNLGSQEQARGIEQIAKAVEHINQVTQATAAGAEESASAGEELSAQAAALRQIVEQMRAMVGGEVSTHTF